MKDKQWFFKKHVIEKKTVAEIAEMLNKPHGTIWNKIKRWGFLLKHKQPSRLYQKREWLEKKLKSRYFPSDIAHESGVTENTIRTWIKKLGLSQYLNRRKYATELTGLPPCKAYKRIDNEGYILVGCPWHPKPRQTHNNGNKMKYVAEHRLKMEVNLGRFLKKNEIVHHVNNNRKDNRLSNLFLMQKSEHSMLHHKLGHCNNIDISEDFDKYSSLFNVSTLKEVAQEKNMSLRTLREKARKAEIPAFKLKVGKCCAYVVPNSMVANQ